VREPPSLQQQQAPNNGYAVSVSANTWNAAPDPSGNPSTYSLIVGNKRYTVVAADTSAQGVASTINSQLGSLVHSSVVAGTGGSADSRIQLTSTSTGAKTLDLQKQTSLQNTQVAGALASYEMLSTGKTVTSNSRAVQVAQGVSLTLKAESNGPVDVIV